MSLHGMLQEERYLLPYTRYHLVAQSVLQGDKLKKGDDSLDISENY
jgi:hypothetical protein